MSAQPRQITNTEIWTQWENQVVHGVFPLRRLLGCSSDTAVFLTEYKAKNLRDAAIKIVRADALQAQAQLVQWGAAAMRFHPHLVYLFEVGRHRFDGQEFVFVVMEYADQTLEQILRQRALTADEVRELLLPTLDALAFLHRNQLVHGQLKPSNFLAVGDQLKLASDTIRRANSPATGIARTSAYDPPERKDGAISAAGDMWGLGMTLIEALSQRTMTWSDRQSGTASLPAGFPAPFADTVRRCLSLAPTNRPTVIELRAQYKPAPPAPAPVSRSDDPPSAPAPKSPPEVIPPQSLAKRQSLPQRRLSLPTIAAALVIALAVWAGFHFSDSSESDLQLSAAPAPAVPSPIAKSVEPASDLVARPLDQSSLPPAATLPAVLHEVMPDVPQGIREKIQGRIYVTVRVLVDPSGTVIGVLQENAGSSKYFTRLADNAAREWQFVPTENQSARVWLLRFEFTRSGVAVRTTAQ